MLLSETLEIFKDYQRRSIFGLRNQLFGDAMVRVSMESCLFAGVKAEIIRDYVETQGTPEEKEGYKQMNLLGFD